MDIKPVSRYTAPVWISSCLTASPNCPGTSSVFAVAAASVFPLDESSSEENDSVDSAGALVTPESDAVDMLFAVSALLAASAIKSSVAETVLLLFPAHADRDRMTGRTAKTDPIVLKFLLFMSLEF